MKIVAFTLGDMVGGAQRSMANLMSGVHSKGHNVTIFTLGKASDDIKHLFAPLNVYGFLPFFIRKSNINNVFLSRLKLFSALIFGFVICAIRSRHYRDTTIYLNDSFGVVLFLIPIILFRPKVVLYIRSQSRPIFFKLAIHFSTLILIISNDLKSVFTKKEKESVSNKIFVLNTGFKFNDKFLNPLSNYAFRELFTDKKLRLHKNDIKNVLLLGSYDPRKGHEDAIKAIAEVRYKCKGVNLIFCGPATRGMKYVNDLKDLVNKFDLNEKVTFLKSTSHPYNLISQSNVLILPSVCEGLPRVLIEAQLAGKPVVSYPVSGAKDIIQSSLCGIISEPNHISLSESICTILNSDLLNSLESCNKRSHMARSKFDYNTFIDKFIGMM